VITPSDSSTGKVSDTPVEVAGGFPRHLTQELLEEESERQERKRWFAPWFLGAAYGLFALAFPLERVIGNFPMKAEAGEGLWWSFLESSGGESLGFLISAICAGLFLPLMTRALAATGLPRSASLTGACCISFSPLLTHAATLPGPESATCLISLLAFWIAAPHEAGSLRTSLAIALGVAASLLDPGGLLIIPALLLRHLSRGASHLSSRRSTWHGFAWGCAYIVSLGLLWGFVFADAPLNRDSRVIQWTIFPGVIGMGLCLLLTASLFIKRQDSMTEDTPRWLHLWFLGGIASLFLPNASGICLAPVAAFAIGDFLTRGSHKPRLLSSILIIAQLVLCVAATQKIRTKDPHAAWRRVFQEVFQEGDRLISDNLAHRYLAKIRWGVPAFSEEEALGTLGGPYVLDLGNQPPFLRRIER
jgi:hypothetical protein